VFGVGVLPDLHSVLPGIDGLLEDIVLRGRLAALGMGRFDDVLNPEDVTGIRAYLTSEAWKAFNGANCSGKSTLH
jgi:quinohemoprotein ethanol dehydrogenase